MLKTRSGSVLWIALATLMLAGTASAQTARERMGWVDLLDRLGSAAPTGENVVVSIVEANTSAGDYAPDVNSSQFTGKTIDIRSGPSGPSSHATNVAGLLFGNSSSMSPGVTEAWSYSAGNWLQSGFIRTLQPLPPLSGAPSKVWNHSWVGSFTDFLEADIDAVRRVDWVIDTQGLIMTAGLGNGSGSLPASNRFLGHTFNALVVGRSDGSHRSGNTRPEMDGPGRMKPDLVAPAGTTSSATPMVGSAAILLVDTARTWPGLSSNPLAERPEVIKAALMAGALHREGWSNNPETSGPMRGITTTPLDPVFGADQVNINHAHMVLTGLQQPGSFDVPSDPVPNTAWDRPILDESESLYYRFKVDAYTPYFSVLATWNRAVAADFSDWELATYELELYRLGTGRGGMQSLRGDAGLTVFGGGNIASLSQVDNVQHLFVEGLHPGEYVLELRRVSDGAGPTPVAVAWFTPPDPFEFAEMLVGERVFGSHVSGTYDDVRQLDGQNVVLRSQFGFTVIEPNLTESAYIFNTEQVDAEQMQIYIYSQLDTPGGRVRVRVVNVDADRQELVSSVPLGTHPIGVVSDVPEAAKFIDANGDIEVRVRHSVVASFSLIGFRSFTDHVHLRVK